MNKSEMSNAIFVEKRDGTKEEVSFDKILTRIKSLSQGEEFKQKLNIDETVIAQKVIQEIHDGVKTSELDELSSNICASLLPFIHYTIM